ncbi:MAG: hypothetical protein AABY22_24120 [Nanoarchaeota archaeon]
MLKARYQPASSLEAGDTIIIVDVIPYLGKVRGLDLEIYNITKNIKQIITFISFFGTEPESKDFNKFDIRINKYFEELK